MANKQDSLPKGFEKRPDEKLSVTRSDLKQAVAQTVNFRPGRGGPGRGPAEIEKADNIKGTASRLLKYFSGAKKQLAGLIVAAAANSWNWPRLRERPSQAPSRWTSSATRPRRKRN